MLNKLGKYCQDNNIDLYAACDQDDAGKMLLKALESPYKDVCPPIGKDIGEMLEKRGREALRAFYGHLQVTEGVI